ncbi:MAG: hypothetical protein Q7T60_06950 [Sphingopyxis sp.]|nr:hypothetical protein [Sphingopyxis sp.]
MVTDTGWLVAAALAIPALLIALVPRRWLGRTMLAWALVPLIAYAGAIAWEGATRTGTDISIENAVLGFSLISALFIIPWAIACALGFAIGFGLRALFRRAEPTTPEPNSAAAAAPPAAQPLVAAEPMSISGAEAIRSDAAAWRQVHIGFSDDGLTIGGLDVWALPWRSVDTVPLQLAHPAYPEEIHRFTVQEVQTGPTVVRFAASELSNGVWGFYVPRPYPGAVAALTADGSLRYEQRVGDVGTGPHAPASWAVLIDMSTQHVVVDCVSWPASRISGNADGSLFLRLQQDDGETLLRIDPIARTFRNQSDNGAERPLAELADAVARLRRPRADLPPGPHYRHISPDGTIRIDTEAVEWGNSHWVLTPRVIDIMSGRVVLDLWNSDWDATISYPGNRRVALDFRRYHFSGDLAIELDLENDLYRITREPGATGEFPSGPLAEAADAMEASGRRVAELAATQDHGRPIWNPNEPHGRFAAWRTALVIFIVAAVLIGVATALSLNFAPEAKPVLIRAIPKPDLKS